MKKINITQILKITGSIVTNACIIFTAAVCAIGIIGYLAFKFVTMETPDVFATLAYAAVISASYKVFSVKILPAVSRHIIFFALIYASFIFIYMPVVNSGMNSKTTFYLTVIFIILYLTATGLVQLVRHTISKIRSKNQGYNDQFSQLKK